MALPPASSAAAFAGEPASEQHLVNGPLIYCHYGADGFNDRGWGCGYRTVQTMCSWLACGAVPPSIPDMQKLLGSSSGSDWIGVPEAVVVLDTLFDATCEVIHLRDGSELPASLPRLASHFAGGGGPVMVGGGGDVYSKTLVGVQLGERPGLLILDPHYEGRAAHDGDARALREGGWAAWRPLDALRRGSFYNLALLRPPPPLEQPVDWLARLARLAQMDAESGGGGAPGAAAEEEWAIEVVESG